MSKKNPMRIIFYALTFLLAVIILLPFFFVVMNSFKSYSEIIINASALPESPSFANYLKGIEKVHFWRLLGNTVFITAISIVGMIVFGSMAAWKIARVKSRTSSIMYATYILAMIIPFQSIMIPLVVVAAKLNMLHAVGLSILYWGFGMPLTIFLYKGYFNYVPRSLEESAKLDGCNDFILFWKILFPQLRTMTSTIVILQSLWVWNDFLLPFLILIKRNHHTIPLGINSFFGIYKAQWDMALPILVMGMIPLIIGFLAAQKHIVRSIASSGLKG
ncbi:MAG: carbohydrate ABC transporter permease [Spirochaetales bacterium]|nr:carbohydrate ABC transporter permease [Spirochaetales bacterium]